MNQTQASSSDAALRDLKGLLPEFGGSLQGCALTSGTLSMQETRTAGLAADRLRAAGYEVTTGVGKTGVVGLLRNGDGPTVMLRAPTWMRCQSREPKVSPMQFRRLNTGLSMAHDLTVLVRFRSSLSFRSQAAHLPARCRCQCVRVCAGPSAPR